MADIATIGFASDSSGLVAAEQALKRLPPAAKAAETAADNVAASISGASAAAAGLSTATGNAVKGQTAAAGGIAAIASATNKMTTAQKAAATTINAANGAIVAQVSGTNNLVKAVNAAGAAQKANAANTNNARTATQGLSADAKNLTFQLVDVTQGILSGQRPFQIFAQQAGQIGQIAATTKGGIGALFGEIFSLATKALTPVRLLTAGIIGLGIGAVVAVNNVIASAKAIDDLARSTDQANSRISALQQSFQKKGVSPEEFAAGFKSFSDEVYNAQRNMGSLNGLMIANGQQAKTNQQYFARVADLVARTASDVQKQKILEAAGLPTTRQWVEYMSMGSKGIEAAIAATVGFNNAAEQNLLKKAKQFDEMWNTATTNMTNYFKSFIVSAIGGFETLVNSKWFQQAANFSFKFNPFTAPIAAGYDAAKALLGAKGAQAQINNRFGEFDTPGNADKLRSGLIQQATGNKNQAKTQGELLAANQQAQQRISILGELLTVEDQVKLKELELAAAGLQRLGVDEKKAAQILNATRAQAEMNRVNQQAQIGIFNLGEAQKAASDTLQMWIDKGLVNKNNATEMAAAQQVLARSIKQTSDAAQVAAAPLQQLKQLELDASNLSKLLDQGLTNSLNALVSPIQDVLNNVTSLGDGFRNMGIIVLKAIQEMIIKMLIIAPIAKGLKAIFAGFMDGGIFSASPADALASGIAPLKNGGAFARGGTFTNRLYNQPTPFMFAGGSKFGVMGEAGPEAVMPLRRGPNGSLGVQMFGGNTQHNNDNMALSYAPQFFLGGNASQDDIANLRKEMRQDRKEFVAKTSRAIQEIRKRSGAI